MTKAALGIRRKPAVLNHAAEARNVATTCPLALAARSSTSGNVPARPWAKQAW